MPGARWRSTLETRLAERDDRGVALLTALIFMVFATGLSLVLLSAILSQSVPNYTAQKNARTVYAAEAGLQSALAVIRSADGPVDASGHVYGTKAKLPCTLAGRLSADGTGPTYAVTVQYFTVNPADLTASERATSALGCSSAGVSAGTLTVPRYAFVSSSGLDTAIPGNANAAAGNRTLSATYTFQVTNLNIAGGLINAGSGACLEAVTATAGSLVKLVGAAACLKTPRQLWNYAADYELKLASSTAAGAPGLCITGPTNADGVAKAGEATLQPCRADTTRWNQLWSWTGEYTWRAQNKENTGVSNFRLSPGSGAVGNILNVTNGVNGKFAPTLEIGAGAASKSTNQLVNYREFGRCADVTSEQIGSTYMISYPCKQDPTGSGANLLWNHKWYYNEPDLPASTSPLQDIHVFTADGSKRCLARGAGDDVVFKTCDSTAVGQQWTRTNKTDNYDSSYLLINQGKCLFADSTKLHSDGTSSKLRMGTCNGSLAQKWNAPPTATKATIGGYSEVAG